MPSQPDPPLCPPQAHDPNSTMLGSLAVAPRGAGGGSAGCGEEETGRTQLRLQLLGDGGWVGEQVWRD